MSDWLTKTFLTGVGSAIDGWAWLSEEASDLVVNNLVTSTRNRPHPWSTLSEYTSWQSLTDRTYLARHLPPAILPIQPAEEQIRKLFERPDGSSGRRSKKSTCLFAAFD